MDSTSCTLCEEIQGAQFAYVQSDEISILIHNYKTLESGAWFDNELQKLVSVSAGIASAAFSMNAGRLAVFDSRAFVLPEAEVANYFIWRQKDWERNSVAMLAQSLFSHKELHGENKEQQKEMCFLKGQKWEDLSGEIKNGRMVAVAPYTSTWEAEVAPIFMQNRNVIEDYLKTITEEENENIG